MKKIIMLFLTMILISSCSMNNKEVDGVENAATPNVMINNRLYHTTGELYDGRPFNEANENDRNQQYEVDGVITSTVEGYMLPEKNNQSDLGVDCEYHIIDDENSTSTDSVTTDDFATSTDNNNITDNTRTWK